MSSENKNLELDIYAWRYSSVLQETIDHPTYELNPIDCPWIIAALSFTGRVTEAEGVFTSRVSELSDSQLIVARFFLGLGICREKREQDARRIFLQNLKSFHLFAGSPGYDLLSAASKQKLRFFAFQGLAFFRYSSGQFKRASLWSGRSLQAASASLIPYASILAHELSGHILLQLGLVQRGMRHLEIARSKAEVGGLGQLSHAMGSSKRLYRATFGLSDAQSILSELNEGIVRCKFEDSYTLAGLNIQLSHALILTGRLDEALVILERATASVYQVDNPYLESLYNLTLAQIQAKKGALHVALTIAKTSARNEAGRTHLPSLIKSLGLQSQLMSQLDLHREKRVVDGEIRQLTQRTGGHLARRILGRQQAQVNLFSRGEDPLGDLIDDVHAEKPGVMTDILKSGWLDLLNKALKILPTEQVIYFDIEPGAVTIFKFGNVYHKLDGSTDLIRKTLIVLNQYREINKEQFTQKIWAQEYNPLRHDNLIYGLIARTRKLLSPYQNVIEATDQGYRLNDGLTVRFHKNNLRATDLLSQDEKNEFEKGARKGKEPIEGLSASSDSLSLLSLRQIQILEWSDSGKAIEAKDLVDGLTISDATATRDLGKLVELGFLVRRGSGRATYYIRNNNHERKSQ